MAKANLRDAPTPDSRAAEALIVKGKEQGFLRPDDIVAGFPDVELDPDQQFRIFNVFRDMGIEVSDREMVVSPGAPVRAKMVGRATLTAEQALALGKAIKTGDHDTRHKILEAASIEELSKIVYLTKGRPGWLEI
jgi:hypothetical protein